MAFSQEKSEAAFNRIQELGGDGVWDADMVAITMDGTDITDDDLAMFEDCDFVQILGLSNTKINRCRPCSSGTINSARNFITC